MRKNLCRLLSALLVLALPLCAGNILINPGFETGDFTGWTTSGNFEFTYVVSGGFYAYTGAQAGDYYAVMGPVGSDGILSQSFADIAGETYNFSFWINAIGDQYSDFAAYWNAVPLVSLSDPTTDGAWTQIGTGLLSFTQTGSGNDTISFHFRDDPAFIALDSVSVDRSGNAPEPATFLLVGAGLILFGYRFRRS
jgi:hypothetical protein